MDFRALKGTPIYAVADGVVVDVKDASAGHNYGTFVRVNHTQNYQTTYAHFSHAGVQVGDRVKAGDQLGLAGDTGNTGNPPASHLHLTLKQLGNTFTDWQTGIWPYSIFDPTPFLEHFEGVTWPGGSPGIPNVAKIDLLPYLRGDGRMYEVQHKDGPTETFQTQVAGKWFYQVKNSQWEEFSYDGNMIYRRRDTSPGPAPTGAERPGVLRWYTQYTAPFDYAAWCPRYMAIGQEWTGAGHQVQFYYKVSGCPKSATNSGGATNRVKLVARHPKITWNGITVEDVVQLYTYTTGEFMWFARGYGLVAWGNNEGSASAISEIHSGRASLVRETLPC